VIRLDQHVSPSFFSILPQQHRAGLDFLVKNTQSFYIPIFFT
jgi:hypothetical protein